MNMESIENNPYLLLTPGPLSTTKRVKAAMLKDYCTWDDDYNNIIQTLRKDLVALATENTTAYTAVLMQGSGTFCVESVVGSALGQKDKLLVLVNGAYGARIGEIAKVLGIDYVIQDGGETAPIDFDLLEQNLSEDKNITHVAVVHCETTTGMLNDIKRVSAIVKSYGKTLIIDAMSSFGGVPIDVNGLSADFLISSANKCIQGVPGFGFIIARRDALEKCKGQGRSLSLDLYDQWKTMEKQNGKWRFTSPTHVVRAFCTAMEELTREGGIPARYERYRRSQERLAEGMNSLGFEPLLPKALHSPIITSFRYPENADFTFNEFYGDLKEKGYVIYPGKISKEDTFRIGNIGDVHLSDIENLLLGIEDFVHKRAQ